MAAREARYRRDERDDASFSDSESLSPSPPPARRRNRSELHSPRLDRDGSGSRVRPRDDADPRYRPTGSRLDRDRERDRDRDRDSPPAFSARRQSFTDRIRNSWNVRKDALRGTPPPYPPNSSSQRRDSRTPSRRPSSAVGSPSQDKANPLAKVRHWIDTCNTEHGDHCTGIPRSSSGAAASSVAGPNGDDSDLGSGLPPPGGAGEPLTWYPIWLIDSVDRRLIRARAGDRYMALTYVNEGQSLPWAAPPNAHREARRDNVDMLTAGFDHVEMPQAIQDAIWLARKLGIRLLWVDRFCIVQDDEAERDAYISNMAYVFANAYLTVVAAAGENANTGLSALVSPGGRAPPPVPKDALGSPGRQGHRDMVTSSRWRERCWTMQEGFYARRALFVFDKTMTWECHCQTWNLAGDVDAADGGGPRGPGVGAASKVPGLQRVLSLRGSSSAPPSRKGRNDTHQKCAARPRPAPLGFRHAPWPDLDEYARICMDFSGRRLSRVEDTTAAFRGFTTIVNKTFAGGFVFGMPVLFLDAALLWRPAATIRRRRIAPSLDSGGMNPVPSWSWMGWYYDGVPVDLTFWRAAADYVLEDGAGSSNGKGGEPGGRRTGEDDEEARDGNFSARRRFRNVNGFRLRTTCQFYLTDRATTEPLRNDGMRYRAIRHARRSNNGGLPPGWSKVGGGGAFRHTIDPNATFRYPIPLISDTPPVEMPISGEMVYPGTLLSFNTTRAFLEVDFAAPFPERPTGGDGGGGGPRFGGIPLAIGSIWAPRSGQWIGTLRGHDAWLGLQGANYESEEGRLEFVAISEGTERAIGGPAESDVFGPGADMKELRANADPDGFVDFVNVLWVERVGSVCFRRGVGHIFLRAWEAFGRERVDILLG
ncbi:hypothetical protein ACRALDRAFT_1065605 [Sodiomyces alcalophilus JCM 7366]|uniref:uncharacterized protein n=1 Tax=Sodiomyces alcalophilus JCM 7366 TaxID=591952 RepID=UPI0039B5F1A8